ncbi:NAD(P)-binding protein [Trametes cingulata]|nr:NAD(P)-binding protein [Trametes cingulata]
MSTLAARVSRITRSIAFRARSATSRAARSSISYPSRSYATHPSSSTQQPLGVARALQASAEASPSPTLFSHEFSLADRVALVSGALGGLGLEATLALVEAGVRAVYCIDLPKQPSDEWVRVRDFAAKMEGKGGEGRMEYVSVDIRDQEAMWRAGETTASREGRLDVCVAAAGVLGDPAGCLDLSAAAMKQLMDPHANGALFTAQAAGRQMQRLGSGGSIVLIASIAGYRAFRGHPITHYHVSKATVIQMARSLACELAPEGIRVNSISPGFMQTKFLKPYLDARPEFVDDWGQMNPMGRIGRPHELRGALVWLASDASSFCTGSDIVVDGGHRAW